MSRASPMRSAPCAVLEQPLAADREEVEVREPERRGDEEPEDRGHDLARPEVDPRRADPDRDEHLAQHDRRRRGPCRSAKYEGCEGASRVRPVSTHPDIHEQEDDHPEPHPRIIPSRLGRGSGSRRTRFPRHKSTAPPRAAADHNSHRGHRASICIGPGKLDGVRRRRAAPSSPNTWGTATSPRRTSRIDATGTAAPTTHPRWTKTFMNQAYTTQAHRRAAGTGAAATDPGEGRVVGERRSATSVNTKTKRGRRRSSPEHDAIVIVDHRGRDPPWPGPGHRTHQQIITSAKPRRDVCHARRGLEASKRSFCGDPSCPCGWTSRRTGRARARAAGA